MKNADSKRNFLLSHQILNPCVWTSAIRVLHFYEPWNSVRKNPPWWGGGVQPTLSQPKWEIPDLQEPGMWQNKARRQIQTPAWPPWPVWEILQCHVCIYMDFPHIFPHLWLLSQWKIKRTVAACPQLSPEEHKVTDHYLSHYHQQQAEMKLIFKNPLWLKQNMPFLQWCITSSSYLQGFHNKYTKIRNKLCSPRFTEILMQYFHTCRKTLWMPNKGQVLDKSSEQRQLE